MFNQLFLRKGPPNRSGDEAGTTSLCDHKCVYTVKIMYTFNSDVQNNIIKENLTDKLINIHSQFLVTHNSHPMSSKLVLA